MFAGCGELTTLVLVQKVFELVGETVRVLSVVITLPWLLIFLCLGESSLQLIGSGLCVFVSYLVFVLTTFGLEKPVVGFCQGMA